MEKEALKRTPERRKGKHRMSKSTMSPSCTVVSLTLAETIDNTTANNTSKQVKCSATQKQIKQQHWMEIMLISWKNKSSKARAEFETWQVHLFLQRFPILLPDGLVPECLSETLLELQKKSESS